MSVVVVGLSLVGRRSVGRRIEFCRIEFVYIFINIFYNLILTLERIVFNFTLPSDQGNGKKDKGIILIQNPKKIRFFLITIDHY